MPGFDLQAQERLTQALKAQARLLGFDACGIAAATHLDEEARRLETWLHEGRNAGMGWMGNHFDKRVDPRKLVDGAQTVVSLLHTYYQPHPQPTDPAAGRISRYAWGDDYHDVLRDKLYLLFAWLQEQVGSLGGRVFVDSAPVLDKAWALRAGLGWMGKHTNIINPSLGSYFFIAEMIVDVPLTSDAAGVPDHCGSCTRCIDACPTDAIYQPYAVDANRCISYLTIENRESFIPAALAPDVGNWIFGCDICQEVCPWNKFKKPTTEPRFAPRPGVPDTALETWAELDLVAFREIFRKSPVKRAKLEGFLRNVQVALQNATASGKGERGQGNPEG